jgi:hypothetical protein
MRGAPGTDGGPTVRGLRRAAFNGTLRNVTGKRSQEEQLLVPAAEAAAALGMSRRHFDRHVRPYIRLVYSGDLRLFVARDLERWIDREGTIGGRAAPAPPLPVPAVLLRRDDAAAAMGMSLRHFQRHVLPRVRTVRSGSRILVRVAELERWAESEQAAQARARRKQG